METYRLTRSGNSPIAFQGDRIAESHGRLAAEREQTRWHDLAVYRTEGGRYVLAITYRTQWQGEQGHEAVIVLDEDATHLIDALHDYDPLAHVAGYPPGAQFERRQQALLDSIRARWETQVSDLLAQVPGSEERI